MEGYDSTTYGDAFADVYDEWYHGVSDVDVTVADLVRLARDTTTDTSSITTDAARAGASESRPVIVELGVGTGRLAIPLAAAIGHGHVIGIDTSSAMLDRLRERQRDLGGDTTVEVVHGDMVAALESVVPGTDLDLVFVAYNTLFNLADDGAQQRCFHAVAQRLAPGGRFVVEAFVPDDPPRDGSDVTVRSMSVDRVVLSVSRHDARRQSAEGHFVEFTEAGGVRLRPWSIRYSSPSELDAMAAAAGLELESRVEAFGGEPFTADSTRHVSVYSTSN